MITVAPDVLEDDDVLEMVNAGLAPITVVDDYLAEFWRQVFTNITVHQDVTVRTGGSLAVAFRKENPRLREVVNTWIRKHGKGDAFPKRARTALSPERRSTRKTPQLMPSVRSWRQWSSCSRSTEHGTKSTTC